MTDKKVTIEMDVFSAAAVRQVLFESQKNYTYNVNSVPKRIVDIREVITDIDDKIESIIEE
jgi:hypothetical protein